MYYSGLKTATEIIAFAIYYVDVRSFFPNRAVAKQTFVDVIVFPHLNSQTVPMFHWNNIITSNCVLTKSAAFPSPLV